MRCPKCNKNLMTEQEKEKWGFCTDCYNGDWTDRLKAGRTIDIDEKIQQAKNLIKNYERLNKGVDSNFYGDAIEHYKNYLKELEELKNND